MGEADAERGGADPSWHGGRGELSADELRYAVAEALRWAIVRASERAEGKKVEKAEKKAPASDAASTPAGSGSGAGSSEPANAAPQEVTGGSLGSRDDGYVANESDDLGSAC